MGMMPITLREGSVGHRIYVIVPWLFVVAAIVYVPLAPDIGWFPGSIDKAARIGQLNELIAYAVAILGLQLVIGYSGQLSLGQSAFVGLGAYTTVILVADHHWSYLATLPVSIAVCCVAGLIVGVPATRVKGVYLAIVTLLVAFVFPSLILRFGWLTGGPNGKGPARTEAKLLPPSWMPFADAGRLAGPLWVYSISVVLATLLFLLTRNIIRSRPGRALIAMRDYEASATAVGINVGLYKVFAVAASAVFGGLAGSMLMMNRAYAIDAQYGTRLAIFLVVGLVVGGAGTISGAAVGAFVYLFVPYFVSQWTFDQSGMPPGIRQVTAPLFVWLRPAGGEGVGIFFGLLLVLLMFVLPGGFIDGVRRLRARVVRVVPRPAWLAETSSSS
ncbi:MAG: putative branched-chain amino acid transporter permease protein [Ilumatobacteraceae bacterium]|nr:putative branched-chain amino acid transporter permease protein [Ilumatobacteraceae bacterium]